MTHSLPERSDTVPYRPEKPNKHWLAGEAAQRFGVPRDRCTLALAGNRWEWEAGWDYAEATNR